MTSQMKPDILCFSSSDWDGKWGSRQQVMMRFARRGYRVLFVEKQVGLEHLLRYPDIRRRKWKRWREGLILIQENLWGFSLPPLIPGRYYNRQVARLNQKLVLKWVRPSIRQLNLFPEILWLYRPEDEGLIGQFSEKLSVYHCIDEFTSNTFGCKRENITWLEERLLKKVDIVFANSLITHRKKKAINPKTFRVPSGADVDHFNQALKDEVPSHPVIAKIPRPIAGYIGNINEKLDIALLISVAQKMPTWQFVFVGKPYSQMIGLSELEGLPNVRFLGWFPFAEIPAIMKVMDVCLLPYADVEYTKYRSPLKLYEYLAGGKPIVSTEHPEVREFEAFVRFAQTPEEFADAIERTYQNETPDKQKARLEESKKHSWEQRVQVMENVISNDN